MPNKIIFIIIFLRIKSKWFETEFLLLQNRLFHWNFHLTFVTSCIVRICLYSICFDILNCQNSETNRNDQLVRFPCYYGFVRIILLLQTISIHLMVLQFNRNKISIKLKFCKQFYSKESKSIAYVSYFDRFDSVCVCVCLCVDWIETEMSVRS